MISLFLTDHPSFAYTWLHCSFFELGEEIFDMGMLDVMGSEMVKREAELSCLMILYYTVSAIDIAFDA